MSRTWLADGISWQSALAELSSMGHAYVESTRLPRFLQEAAKDVVSADRWLPRQRVEVPDATGRIAGLGQITQVTCNDSGLPLSFSDRDALEARYGLPWPAAAATLPMYWYEADYETIATYPATTLPLSVRHLSRGCWERLSGGVSVVAMQRAADTDTFALGEAFTDALILRARVLILEDTDEIALRDAYAQRYDNELDELRDEYLSHNADEPDRIQHYGEWA